jgi:hypothetical protein
MDDKSPIEVVAERIWAVRGAVLLPRDSDRFTPAMLEALSEIVMMLAGEIEDLQARVHELDGRSPGRLS